MPNARRLVLASLLALIVLPSAAQARKPIVAYVDAGQRLHLYDAQLGREVAAPALAIPDRIRGFGVSSDGHYIAYRDAAKVTHLYDRSRGTDTALPDAQGTPRSVSNAGVIASDAADNGPTRLYDGVAKKALPSGLDDANGDNKHRQSRISGDGRFLATTCLAGCLKDTGGDSDLFVEDLRALADTAFPDDISGQAARDEEHPCISGDGRLVGADTAVGNQHDVFVYDRTAKRTLNLPQINRPNADDIVLRPRCPGGVRGPQGQQRRRPALHDGRGRGVPPGRHHRSRVARAAADRARRPGSSRASARRRRASARPAGAEPGPS